MPLLDRLKIVPQTDDESVKQIPQDPVPDERPAPRGRKPTTKRVVTPRAPTVTKLSQNVAADLTTLFQMTAAAWSLTDQCCAPVLEQQSEEIAKTITAILARNPRLLAKFAQADTAVYVMQALALGRALLPVGRAVYINHVSKSDHHGEGGTDGGLDLDNFPAYAGRPR